jgi:hypothetical protein
MSAEFTLEVGWFKSSTVYNPSVDFVPGAGGRWVEMIHSIHNGHKFHDLRWKSCSVQSKVYLYSMYLIGLMPAHFSVF